MTDLRQLTHEQLIGAISTRLTDSSRQSATRRPGSTYRSEPTARPVRIEVYKPRRRAQRALALTEPAPVAEPAVGLELTYADFIASARSAARSVTARIA